MNKLIVLVIGLVLVSMVAGNYAMALWEKKAEPKQDVWQESCNPIVLLKDAPSCQQANYMIKQNAEIIQLLKEVKK